MSITISLKSHRTITLSEYTILASLFLNSVRNVRTFPDWWFPCDNVSRKSRPMTNQPHLALFLME